jgi:hypothetical protein
MTLHNIHAPLLRCSSALSLDTLVPLSVLALPLHPTVRLQEILSITL